MRIAAVTMQKDETELLEFWAAYHGKLFGYENLMILDNGSSNFDTLRILANLERLGVRVLEKSGRYDFECKGLIISEIAETEKESYDWIFPLDIDELVVLEIDGRLSTAREDIFAEFDRAASEGRPVLRVSRSYWNIPQTTGAYALGIRKSIVRTGGGIQLDMGYHLFLWNPPGPTIDASNFAETRIGYVHFHNRFFPDLLFAARQKLRLRVPDYSPATLQNYQGAGRHTCRYFTITETDYYTSFPERQFSLCDLGEAAQLPVPYSGKAPLLTEKLKQILYSQLNLDAPEWASIGEEIKQVLGLMTPNQPLFEYGISDISLAAIVCGFTSVSGVLLQMKDEERSEPEHHPSNLVKIGIQLAQADSVLGYAQLAKDADAVVIGGPHGATIAASIYLNEKNSIAILKDEVCDREKKVIASLFDIRRIAEGSSVLEKRAGKMIDAERILAACVHHAE